MSRPRLCPKGTCLPCDWRRRPREKFVGSGELFATSNKLRVRKCPLHGDEIAPDSPDDVEAVHHALRPRGLPRPVLRAKPEAVAARRRELGLEDEDLRRSVRAALEVDT